MQRRLSRAESNRQTVNIPPQVHLSQNELITLMHLTSGSISKVSDNNVASVNAPLSVTLHEPLLAPLTFCLSFSLHLTVPRKSGLSSIRLFIRRSCFLSPEWNHFIEGYKGNATWFSPEQKLGLFGFFMYCESISFYYSLASILKHLFHFHCRWQWLLTVSYAATSLCREGHLLNSLTGRKHWSRLSERKKHFTHCTIPNSTLAYLYKYK